MSLHSQFEKHTCTVYNVFTDQHHNSITIVQIEATRSQTHLQW